MSALPRYWVDEEFRPRSHYVILDRVRGHGTPLARVDDPEIAERIARLLNADLERTERQGAVVP